MLQKDANFKKIGLSIASIACDSATTGITTFVELIIAAACTCKDCQTYIGWIMNMGDANKSCMKAIIESSLSQISDCDNESAEVSEDKDYESGASDVENYFSDGKD